MKADGSDRPLSRAGGRRQDMTLERSLLLRAHLETEGRGLRRIGPPPMDRTPPPPSPGTRGATRRFE